MAFINKDDEVLIEAKLTAIGRQQLAYGLLQFKKYAVGDSEIDYQYADEQSLDPALYNVLRPLDNQPNFRYPVLKSASSMDYLQDNLSVDANERLVTNTAKERGFFTRATVNDPYEINLTLLKGSGTGNSASNGNSFTGTFGTGTTFSVGDVVLINWYGNSSTAPTVGEIGDDNPHAWLWYQVISISGGGTTAVFDRPLVKATAGMAGNFYQFHPLSPGQITNYENGINDPFWDTETLATGNPASTNTTDVPVWNYSIIHASNVMGASAAQQSLFYDSKTYEGLRTYLGERDLLGPLGVLHYTNHSNNNYYGEGLVPSTLKVELPTIMYHADNDSLLGLQLKADATKKALTATTSTTTGFSLVYHDLVTPGLEVVGKVFPDLKMVAIEDPEILAATSYVSNRNWTLPAFKTVGISAGSTDVVTNTSSTLYLTYALFANDPTNPKAYNESLPCQKIYKRVVAGLTSVDFSFLESDFRFLSGTLPNSNGFTANKLVVLFQLVPNGGSLEHDKWVPMDGNTIMGIPVVMGGEVGGTPLPQNITAAILAKQTYRFTLAQMTTASNAAQSGDAYYKMTFYDRTAPVLNFGAEQLFFGNVKTDIKAIAYTTTFRLKLDVNEFDTSVNPTWTTGQPVYITEIGIYDDNNNIVVVGKLNYPIKKDSNGVTLISLDLDF